MIRLATIGYGLWGRNVARVAAATPGARLVGIAERDADRRGRIHARHPGIELHADGNDVLLRDDVDAVLITTEAPTHADWVERAARAGKHVFVEKPLALTPESARRADAAAREAGRLLFVGHLMRYHPAVELLFEVARRELGRIRSVSAQRLNFGKVRSDENVLFSLGPHDLSIMLELFGQEPVAVAAHGAAFVREGIEDLCFVTLHFADGGIGQIHLSWLDPHKVRRVTVVGDRRMAVFDDMEPREKIRIYDQGFEGPNGYWVYGENLAQRTGEIRVPSFPAMEPLSVEIRHFVDCVTTGAEPRTPGRDGIRVVDVLDAAQRSMRIGGSPVELAGATA